MTTGFQHSRRLAVLEAAKGLARDAIAAARDARALSSDWQFYHGVEAAALHVLRPEMAAVHEGTDWLDNRDPAFRDGFLEASNLLAAAMSAAEPPLWVRLPHPAPPPVTPRG